MGPCLIGACFCFCFISSSFPSWQTRKAPVEQVLPPQPSSLDWRRVRYNGEGGEQVLCAGSKENNLLVSQGECSADRYNINMFSLSFRLGVKEGGEKKEAARISGSLMRSLSRWRLWWRRWLDDGVSIFECWTLCCPISPIISFYVAARSLSNLLWWSGYPVIILIISPSRHLKRRIPKRNCVPSKGITIIIRTRINIFECMRA